jgi:cytochrome d ubiquinol oxidase subunit I
MTGVMVAVSGTASAVFVTAVNAWMNEPVGFRVVDGQIVDIDPWAAFASPSFVPQAIHVVLGAYVAVAFVAMGIHAVALRRAPDDRMHRHAFTLAMAMAIVTTPLQIASGDHSAKHIAANQPLRLAAAEGHFTTSRGAPIAIGGWPDLEAQKLEGAVHVPYVLSVLATGDPQGEVLGLDIAEPELWPPIAVTHLAFDLMVGCGSLMLLFCLWAAFAWWRGRVRPWANPRLLRAALWCSPLGVIAIEAGWTVTEVGRQPWVVRGVLKTADAVTPMPNVVVTLVGFTALFVALGVVVILLLRNLVRSSLPRGRR